MNLALAIAGLGCFLLAFGHTTIGLRWVLPNLTNGSLPSTPPNAPHTFRPWRIHELARDLRLEDVWALPTPGGPDDVPGRPSGVWSCWRMRRRERLQDMHDFYAWLEREMPALWERWRREQQEEKKKKKKTKGDGDG
jgi:hypothetical protein